MIVLSLALSISLCRLFLSLSSASSCSRRSFFSLSILASCGLGPRDTDGIDSDELALTGVFGVTGVPSDWPAFETAGLGGSTVLDIVRDPALVTLACSVTSGEFLVSIALAVTVLLTVVVFPAAAVVAVILGTDFAPPLTSPVTWDTTFWLPEELPLRMTGCVAVEDPGYGAMGIFILAGFAAVFITWTGAGAAAAGAITVAVLTGTWSRRVGGALGLQTGTSNIGPSGVMTWNSVGVEIALGLPAITNGELGPGGRVTPALRFRGAPILYRNGFWAAGVAWTRPGRPLVLTTRACEDTVVAVDVTDDARLFTSWTSDVIADGFCAMGMLVRCPTLSFPTAACLSGEIKTEGVQAEEMFGVATVCAVGTTEVAFVLTTWAVPFALAGTFLIGVTAIFGEAGVNVGGPTLFGETVVRVACAEDAGTSEPLLRGGATVTVGREGTES